MKEELRPKEIESQTVITLPDRPLMAFLVPFSDLISVCSLLLSSCFFLLGLVRPAATTTPFGRLLKAARKRAGASQRQLSRSLGVSASRVSKWETGASDPPQDPEFYDRLQAVPGFSEVDITLLREAAEADKSIPNFTMLAIKLLTEQGKIWQIFESWRWNTQAVEEAQDPHLRFPNVATGKYGKIPSRTAVTKVKSGEHLTEHTPDPEKQVDPSVAQGTNAPESGLQQPGTEPEQGQQAPKKGDIYKRPRSHYDSDYLRENAGHITSILGDALENDDPALSPEHKQALHVIVESIVKKKGASLNKVSQEKHIPHPSLWDWVRKGLVPVLYRDKRTIYLANEIAEEVSHDYRDAKEMNYSAARLLRERREKYFPEEAARSRI